MFDCLSDEVSIDIDKKMNTKAPPLSFLVHLTLLEFNFYSFWKDYLLLTLLSPKLRQAFQKFCSQWHKLILVTTDYTENIVDLLDIEFCNN